MIISVDLDGTAWKEDWSEIGEFRKNFVRVMHRLWNEGHIIIINSLRDKGTQEYDDAVDHLAIKNIRYHLFNENLPGLIDKYGEARKISAQVHIDDRDLGWIGRFTDGIPDDWNIIYDILTEHPEYCNDPEVNKKQHYLLEGEMPRTGIDIIGQERREQVAKHRRSVESDVVFNVGGQLGRAAIELLQKPIDGFAPDYVLSSLPYGWDVERWAKMLGKPYKDRVAIAGALLCAELDRLNWKPEYKEGE